MKGKDLDTAVTEFNTAVYNYFKENFWNCEKLYRSGLVDWTFQSHNQKPNQNNLKETQTISIYCFYSP